jgi:hypothetical protein
MLANALPLLLEEGPAVYLEALGTLSPHVTEHINCFGNYAINARRMLTPLEPHLAYPYRRRSVSFIAESLPPST